MGTIASWMEEAHGVFDDTLRALRRVWPEGDARRQRSVLGQFAEPLERHARFEERVLMPAFAEVADEVPPNGRPHVLRGDHDRLRRLLEELQSLVGATESRAILAEQDRLCQLAGVLEHHDLRERTWFVPALEAHVGGETARSWVDEFVASEAAHPAPTVLAPRPAPDLDLVGLDPIDAFRVAIGRDGDVKGAFRRIETPDHPKGRRHVDRCGMLVAKVGAASTLEERRDHLSTLAESARLLGLVAEAAR